MAEKSTIARPYAQAAFDMAAADRNLKGWSEGLRMLAALVADANLQGIIDNPNIDREVINGLLFDLCGPLLNDKGRNFVRVLNENDRLDVLPEVAGLFEQHRAEAEKTVEAEITSAFPLAEAERAAVTQALKKRLGREVSLKTSVDPAIIGGAVVRAGDLVIDASVIGQLDKLTANLMR